MQADRSSAFEEAEKITVADLLAMGEGKIARNVYVAGSVISDRDAQLSGGLFDRRRRQVNNTMFIQGRDRRPVDRIDDAADNTCDLNQVVYAPHVRDSISNATPIPTD